MRNVLPTIAISLSVIACLTSGIAVIEATKTRDATSMTQETEDDSSNDVSNTGTQPDPAPDSDGFYRLDGKAVRIDMVTYGEPVGGQDDSTYVDVHLTVRNESDKPASPSVAIKTYANGTECQFGMSKPGDETMETSLLFIQPGIEVSYVSSCQLTESNKGAESVDVMAWSSERDGYVSIGNDIRIGE